MISERILVVRNDKLGDFMLAWPALALLAQSLPNVFLLGGGREIIVLQHRPNIQPRSAAKYGQVGPLVYLPDSLPSITLKLGHIVKLVRFYYIY